MNPKTIQTTKPALGIRSGSIGRAATYGGLGTRVRFERQDCTGLELGELPIYELKDLKGRYEVVEWQAVPDLACD